MGSTTMLLILYAGLTHAFEADHLLAISNIVSQRKSVLLALKDGVFWGLGHTSTIVLIGLMMILGKLAISEKIFSYFEVCVGIMLVVIAILRATRFIKHNHIHGNTHAHVHTKNHKVSYGIGLVHGLAGSGALVILAMTQFKTPLSGIGYLIVFGLGSVIGMLMAASLFAIPFSRRIIAIPKLQITLVIASTLLCFVYGLWVIYKNMGL